MEEIKEESIDNERDERVHRQKREAARGGERRVLGLRLRSATRLGWVG